MSLGGGVPPGSKEAHHAHHPVDLIPPDLPPVPDPRRHRAHHPVDLIPPDLPPVPNLRRHRAHHPVDLIPAPRFRMHRANCSRDVFSRRLSLPSFTSVTPILLRLSYVTGPGICVPVRTFVRWPFASSWPRMFLNELRTHLRMAYIWALQRIRYAASRLVLRRRPLRPGTFSGEGPTTVRTMR
jgi:hypothetical protein